MVARRRPSKELPPLHNPPSVPGEHSISPLGSNKYNLLSPQSRELPRYPCKTPSPKTQPVVCEEEKIVKRRGKRTNSMSSEDTSASSRLSSQASASCLSECSTPSPAVRRVHRSSSTSTIRAHKSRSPTVETPTAPTPISGYGDGTCINWVRGKPLGAGHFGTVYKAFDPETLQIFAVKEAPLEDGDRTPKQRERLDLELSICKSLRHKNIVHYLGHDYTEGHLYIYLEYVPGGSLSSLLSEFGPLTGAPLRKAALGMLEGLHYLHTNSPPVIHRDLKGANVLVDLDMCVKLADFGCSKRSAETRTFTTLGSIPWMAPEVITQEGYGRKADIWSFGCTLIEMTTAEKPWGNGAFENIVFALNHIASSDETPKPPEGAPIDCRDMIRECTRRDQNHRPSTTALFKSPWFAQAAAEIKLPLRRTKTF